MGNGWDLEIRRRVPRLPLDVAANAALLIRWDGRPAEYRVYRGTDVAAGHRHRRVRARPALIEASAIHESAIGIEEKQVWRARRAERFRHVLCFVEQVRERIAGRRGFLLHPFEAILGERV